MMSDPVMWHLVTFSLGMLTTVGLLSLFPPED